MSRGKHYVKIDSLGLVEVIIWTEKFSTKYYEENGFLLKEIPDNTGHKGQSLWLNEETQELYYKDSAIIEDDEAEDVNPQDLDSEERMQHLEHAINEMLLIQADASAKIEVMQEELNSLKGSDN